MEISYYCMKKYSCSNDPSTGRWYSSDRKINISAKTAREVPWNDGVQVVIAYDKETDEIKIKRLVY